MRRCGTPPSLLGWSRRRGAQRQHPSRPGTYGQARHYGVRIGMLRSFRDSAASRPFCLMGDESRTGERDRTLLFVQTRILFARILNCVSAGLPPSLGVGVRVGQGQWLSGCAGCCNRTWRDCSTSFAGKSCPATSGVHPGAGSCGRLQGAANFAGRRSLTLFTTRKRRPSSGLTDEVCGRKLSRWEKPGDLEIWCGSRGVRRW